MESLNKKAHIIEVDEPMYSTLFYSDVRTNEYDIILPQKYGVEIIPDDERLGELLYLLIFRNHPGFDVEACLNYHYDKCTINKVRFINFTKDVLTTKPYNQFKSDHLTEHTVNTILKWYDRKKNQLDNAALTERQPDKVIDINDNNILTDIDIKFTLDIDFEKDGFYKSLFDYFKREIDRFGFYQIMDNKVAFNIYHPCLAVVLSAQKITVIDSNQQQLNIQGWKFFDDYVKGYKEGIIYFDDNFAVEPNVLYGSKAESYIQTIHKNYFHEIHEGRTGWHFVKNTKTSNLTHKNIYDFGYYSGIISKVDAMVKKHAPLFKSFDKCDCQSKQHDFDQKPEQATNEPDNEAILLIKLEMFFCSSQKYQAIMELLVEKKYCQPGTYIWKDEKNGNKSFLASVLKYLHKQGYLKDNKKLTNQQIQLIAQNTFGWDIRLDTIKKAKPENFDLKFIPMASTID